MRAAAELKVDTNDGRDHPGQTAIPAQERRARQDAQVATDLHYAREKYDVGLRTLALGNVPLRARLRDAFESSVSRAYDTQQGLGPVIPAPLLERMRLFDESMTRGPSAPGAGTVAGTIAEMSDDEVRSSCEELLSIALELRRETGT